MLNSTLGISRASGCLSGWAPELIPHSGPRSGSSHMVMALVIQGEKVEAEQKSLVHRTIENLPI